MKIKVEVDNSIESNEIVIKCGKIDENIKKVENYLVSLFDEPNIIFYLGNEEFYFELNDILFFETDGNIIYAHTIRKAYSVKHKLYELDNLLPSNFIRVSKSTILNINHVYSINKNIASASLVSFYQTHKQVYVSRKYLKNLCEKMKERRNFV